MKQIARRVLNNLIKQQLRQVSAQSRILDGENIVKSFQEIPGPKGIYLWPMIGTLLHYKPFTQFTSENNHLLFNSVIDQYGPVVKLQLGRLSVLISEPADMETVFNNEGKYPFSPAMDILRVYEKRKGLKGSITTCNGEEWHRLRSPINKRVLKPDSASYYLHSQNAVSDDFVQLLTSKEFNSEEQLDLFYRFASESIGVVVFNTRLGFLNPGSESQESRELLNQTKELFRALQKTFTGASLAHSIYKNKTYLEFEHAFDTITSYARKQLLRAKQEIEKKKQGETAQGKDEPNLFLSLASEQSLSEDDVRSTLESLYTGGTDSTARSLQCLFYNLANSEDKQARLRQDIRTVLGQDALVTAETLSQMRYLKACIKESFRLIYPTTLGPTRILDTDVVLGGYRIPAGVPIMMANFRACKYGFKDSESYIPERWLRSDNGQLPEKFPLVASIPFGHGSRHCVGRRFALQEMELATIKVLQKMKIELDPESRNMEFIYKTFAEPKRPLRFKFIPLQRE